MEKTHQFLKALDDAIDAEDSGGPMGGHHVRLSEDGVVVVADFGDGQIATAVIPEDQLHDFDQYDVEDTAKDFAQAMS